MAPFELNHAVLFYPEPIWATASPGFRVGLLAVYALVLAYFVVTLWTPARQGPHDLAAGTVVTRARRPARPPLPERMMATTLITPIAFTGVVLLAGCASPPPTPDTGPTSPSPSASIEVAALPDKTTETGEVMRRWIDEVWHGGRLDLVPRLVAPLYTRHEDEGTYTVTAEEYAEQIRRLQERFPALHYEIHDSASVGDRFWIRYTFRGGPDSTGPWPKRPGLQVYRLEDGRLAETWMLLRPGGTEWTDPVRTEEIATPGGNHRPNLEGIPNFEDVVALRRGDWIVLLASVEGTYIESPGAGQAAGSVTEAPHPDLAEVQQRMWNRGYIPWVVASEELPSLGSGHTVLILGPYPKEDAERTLAETWSFVPGAQLRLAWPQR